MKVHFQSDSSQMKTFIHSGKMNKSLMMKNVEYKLVYNFTHFNSNVFHQVLSVKSVLFVFTFYNICGSLMFLRCLRVLREILICGICVTIWWSVVSFHRRDGRWSCCQHCAFGRGNGALRYNIEYEPPHRLVLFQYGMTDMNGVHHILDIGSTDDTIGVDVTSQVAQELLVKGLVESWWKRKLHKWWFVYLC